MGRIIKTNSSGKDRRLLEKGIVVAIRELAKQSSLNQATYDLVAYVALSLKAIGETIDESVAAWEKRGFWIKADRYRMEWEWTIKIGEELKQALITDDWINVASLTAQVGQKLNNVNIPLRNRVGTPWIGTWEKLKSPNHDH